ncbi:sigma-54-dependent transcriptional regulator [Dethiosulfatarculus sandiegensis]|uniref:sigma-54-dependent transcriptional regulator n=1 Tax=Dethiosulfatarculus sandiegensis TaxID=1429043 RepID=UPI0005C87426|nr:sigma-54 dependent transcriptional regulator [Dethiosulfatarculus sandiegensis]
MNPPKNSILIIDDEKMLCKACQLVLSEEGYAVEAKSTGTDGLAAALEDNYDVILLDMKMPDLDGMEVLNTLRKEKPGQFIIIITGYSTVQNAVDAMKQGAFDYLAKPFLDDELLLSVKKAVDKKNLIDENIALRKELSDSFRSDKIIGDSPAILRVFEKVRKVALTDSTVLIYGESGTGKELFARAIHAHSGRAAKQFVAVDCSTFSSSILESELFGHVKGAFTGAEHDKAGIFELAQSGTLFLDDVANINLDIQAKLLRVLEAREYKPVGAGFFKKSDVRILAATNKNLAAMVEQGAFREDLFYRLNVFPISLPPLRERKGDIPKLVYHYLRHFCQKTGKHIDGFTEDALEVLINYEWSGNVRQLKNIIERLVIMSEGGIMDIIQLTSHMGAQLPYMNNSVPETLSELKALKKSLLENTFGRIEKAFLIKALKAKQGNITKAAKKVGMHRSNFSALMKKHKLVYREKGEKP